MNTCVIEALYPEVCNLFGDTGNLRYLKLCLPQATFIETALNDEPYFVHHPVSMIYLGPMSEHTQCTVISKLAPYRERIAECIANGVTFLATGNAMEVFGKQITDAQSSVTTGLGLLDLTTTRDMMHRFYSLVLGTYNELQMVGFRAQFTRSTLGATEVPFIQVTNLARTMKQLQSRGIWIFGTSDKGDRGLYETDFTGPAALVMGAEGEGMRRLTEENCDFLLRIPMKGSIPCLNVSVATGVCLYEMVRQRS